MKLLTRKTDDQSLDYRDNPTLKAAKEKIPVLEQRLSTVGREASHAEGVMHGAQTVLEEAQLNELLERGSAQDVETARTAYHQAKEAYDRLKDERVPIERARTLLREEIQSIEMEAMQASLPRLRRAYAQAVGTLAEKLDEAAAASAEVARIYYLAQQCFPMENVCRRGAGISVGGGIEPLFWGELLVNPDNAEGRLKNWRERAQGVLNGQT